MPSRKHTILIIEITSTRGQHGNTEDTRENNQNILTKWLELWDVWSTFFPVVKKFLANSPWSKVALVVVWILHCRQKTPQMKYHKVKVLWIIAKSWPGLYVMGFRILKLRSHTLVPCFNGDMKITCPSYNFAVNGKDQRCVWNAEANQLRNQNKKAFLSDSILVR